MRAPDELAQTAERQVSELLMLLSTIDEEVLRRPCPGREKLGDGTIGAVAWHVADRYERIAAFVASFRGTPAGDDVDPRAVAAKLAIARDELGRIAELTADQLDTVPPAGSFRFCDGRRTLGQVLESLLKHQQRQLDGLVAAIRRP
jgi:hypothetical protein